jgi:hypothetical protein
VSAFDDPSQERRPIAWQGPYPGEIRMAEAGGIARVSIISGQWSQGQKCHLPVTLFCGQALYLCSPGDRAVARHR